MTAFQCAEARRRRVGGSADIVEAAAGLLMSILIAAGLSGSLHTDVRFYSSDLAGSKDTSEQCQGPKPHRQTKIIPNTGQLEASLTPPLSK